MMKQSREFKKAVKKAVEELDRYAFTEGGTQYKFIWQKGLPKPRIVEMPQPIPVNHKRRIKNIIANCDNEQQAMLKIKFYITRVFNNARRNMEAAVN